MDLVNAISAYETEQLDSDGVVELFQELVRTGMAWQLQGHYGRTAQRMIQAGLIESK